MQIKMKGEMQSSNRAVPLYTTILLMIITNFYIFSIFLYAIISIFSVFSEGSADLSVSRVCLYNLLYSSKWSVITPIMSPWLISISEYSLHCALGIIHINLLANIYQTHTTHLHKHLYFSIGKATLCIQ